MEKITQTIGALALFLGTVAAAMTGFYLIKTIPFAIIVALMCGLLGFISSSAYVMLNLRYRVSEKKITPGLIGLFLSSAPVIFILVINAMHKP